MKTKSILKTITLSSVTAALIAVTAGCVSSPDYNAYGDVYEVIYKESDLYKKNKKTIKSIEKDIYRPAVKQQAANKVSSMGYRVKDVKYKQGKRTITVKAERGGEDYKIELGYPNYNVIQIKKD